MMNQERLVPKQRHAEPQAQQQEEEILPPPPPAPHASTKSTSTTATAGQSSSSFLLSDGGVGNVSASEVYHFYAHVLLPAILSSIPILLHRMIGDVIGFVSDSLSRVFTLVLPQWKNNDNWDHHALKQLPEDLMTRFFEYANRDGIVTAATAPRMINPDEVREFFTNLYRQLPNPAAATAAKSSWWFTWFVQEWPLLDWKLGVFLWRTFGGILLVLALLTIIPGRLHGWSARILRWPVLGLTYLLIWVELVVYCIIRLVIRVAEFGVARPKHRRLRRAMARAQSYVEWYDFAQQLDDSQKRTAWLQDLNDSTSYRYNWAFIKELIKDMQLARHKEDSILALAVIQQCTRMNVGGIMSSDLFSYSNTGEPKQIVTEFMKEVVDTLHWIVDQAQAKIQQEAADSTAAVSSTPAGRIEKEKQEYRETVQSEFKKEKDKLWKSLVGWMGGDNYNSDDNNNNIHLHHHNNGNDDDSTHASTISSKQEHDGPTLDKLTRTSSSSTEQQQHPQTQQRETGDSLYPQILPGVHRDEVLAFLKRARASYGRSALCLSGGAMMGLYHLGVIRGLAREGILPHIISGTSAGSALAALVCTRTDDELEELLKPEVIQQRMNVFQRPWKERLRSLWKTGYMFSGEEWMEKLRWFTNGDMTFEEAFEKTGRIFCITLSSTSKKAPPVLLNYLSAPNVTIASASLASGAVPGFVPPVQLQYKDSHGIIRKYGENDQTFYDGSIRQDIPTQGLAEMLNCQFFIASQCNPHIVPFFFNPKGGVGRPSRWSSGNQEHSWRGGFLLAALEMYLKNYMKAKFQFLHEVEASPGFTSTMMTQGFEGSTTIVPQVAFADYLKLFSDPDIAMVRRCFQGGEIAAYEHVSLIKHHYSVADALDDCISKLEHQTTPSTYNQRSSFETSIHTATNNNNSLKNYRQSSNSTSGGASEEVLVLPRVMRPLEQLLTEAIRVKKGPGGEGAITFGSLTFDDDDFEPLHC